MTNKKDPWPTVKENFIIDPEWWDVAEDSDNPNPETPQDADEILRKANPFLWVPWEEYHEREQRACKEARNTLLAWVGAICFGIGLWALIAWVVYERLVAP